MIRPPSSRLSVTFAVRGFDPRSKGRGRVGRWGNVYTPVNTAYYESMLAEAAWMVYDGWMTPPVRLDMWFVFRAAKTVKGDDAVYRTWKPDLDNLSKTADALSGILWRDDAEVVLGTQGKVVAPPGGPHGIVIRVACVPPVLEKRTWKLIRGALSGTAIGRVTLLSESGAGPSRRVRRLTPTVVSSRSSPWSS